MKSTKRLDMVLRAEGSGRSLHIDPQGNLHVLGEKEDGKLYSMGFVSEDLRMQNPEAARKAIERIKFASFSNKTEIP